jgi:hypothetical protein
MLQIKPFTFFLLFSFAGLILSGCKKEKLAVLPPPSTLLIGKWGIVTDTLTDIEERVVISHNSHGLTTDYKQFNKDSTGVEVVNGLSYVFKYQYIVPDYGGPYVHLMYPNQSVGGVLQFAYNRDYAVKSIDNTTLHLYLDDAGGYINDNGVVVSDEFIEDVVLRRQ